MDRPGGIEPLGSVTLVYANNLEDCCVDRSGILFSNLLSLNYTAFQLRFQVNNSVIFPTNTESL